MKGWLGDLLRTWGAWWYWNVRKTFYVARGRTGRCPCQNPSDSGEPGETRCDAVVFWHKPERFARRVCPLLTKNDDGDWVCTVRASAVRPFWRRALARQAAVVAALMLLAGVGAWGMMRAVGFRVSLRQVFWPRAWSELPQVRADFFRAQAQTALAAGKVREAVASLNTAWGLKPGDLATGLLLAQLYQVIQPEAVDGIYRQLLQQHPEQRSDLARVWLRSLLARGRMAELGELARAQLAREPREAAWLHALLMAARWEKNWTLVAAVAADEKLPASVREICALEIRLRQTPRSEAARLLRMTPAPADSYALIHRIERLVEFGESFEALPVLRAGRGLISGRDVARLTLAVHAAGGNRAALLRDGDELLHTTGASAPAAIAIVAQHLVRYPNEDLLGRCRAAFTRLPADGDQADAAAALYCAAALAGHVDWLPELRRHFSEKNEPSILAEQRIAEILGGKNWSPLFLLSVVRPLSLDLNYAVLERMMSAR